MALEKHCKFLEECVQTLETLNVGQQGSTAFAAAELQHAASQPAFTSVAQQQCPHHQP